MNILQGEPPVISEAVTINVAPEGGDVTSLTAALDCLSDKVITSTASGTIQIADGTYESGEPITISHPYGGRIQIRGNETTAGAVVLQFNGSAGIHLPQGSTLGLLSGVTLRGNGCVLDADGACECLIGIHAAGGSQTLGSNVIGHTMQAPGSLAKGKRILGLFGESRWAAQPNRHFCRRHLDS